MLGGPVVEPELAMGPLVAVSRSGVRASAGAGTLAEDEHGRAQFAFDARWLRALTATPSERLTMIRVDGDSMAPTLTAGDDILVDHDDPGAGLRDGIYVLRVDGALHVKRLAVHPFGGRVTVQSDNPTYPDWPDRGLEELSCIGRVIWAGRRIS